VLFQFGRKVVNSVKQYWGGKWRDGSGSDRFEVLNPATAEVLGSYPFATQDEVEGAIAAASEGFREWSTTPAWERKLILLKVAETLDARADLIAVAITNEQGKPVDEAVAEVKRAADFFRWAAGQAVRIYDRVIPSRFASERHVAERRPIGVVCALTPWNYPIVLPAKKLSAALAAGCSVVLKASEETPTGAVELVRACIDAGVPENAICLLFGDPEEISDVLIRDRRVKKVSFTGSIPVGKLLAAKAGAQMKPCTLELGGHAPVLVFEGVNVEAVAKLCVQKKFSNAGQACISPSRFLIQDAVFSSFRDAFIEACDSINVGDGGDSSVNMGPLANARRRDAVRDIVEDCRSQGARIILGGDAPRAPGFFFNPTVIQAEDFNLRVFNEEPFGPIATLTPFAETKSMIAEANRLNVGLAAYAFCADSSQQHMVSQALEAGLVGINLLPGHLPEDPFGGCKQSGFGLEGGEEAVDAYLTSRLVCSGTDSRYFEERR